MHDVASSTERITIPEAAKRFGVNKRTIRSWRNAGKLTRYRSGSGTIYVDPAEVERLARIEPEAPDTPDDDS